MIWVAMAKYKDDCPAFDLRQTSGKQFVADLNGQQSGTVFIVMTGYTGMISYTASRCHYGGLRYWLVCPECQSKRVVLRSRNESLVCNSCLELPYKTASVTKDKRPTIARAKVMKRLGFPESYSCITVEDDCRPSGMHWKKFNRIKSIYNASLSNDPLMMKYQFIGM